MPKIRRAPHEKSSKISMQRCEKCINPHQISGTKGKSKRSVGMGCCACSNLPLSFRGARDAEVLTKTRPTDCAAGFAHLHHCGPATERRRSSSIQWKCLSGWGALDLQCRLLTFH